MGRYPSWTMGDVNVLRLFPPREAAQRLGKTLRQVYHARHRYGLARGLRRLDVATVRRLHAEGRNDGEIAYRMGAWCAVVSAVRRRLGLPVNRRTPAVRAWLRRCRRLAARRVGCDRFPDIVRQNEFLASAREGWPAGTSRRAAAALAAIEAGADTARALGGAMGVSLVSARRWLRRLRGEGWVVRHDRRWALAPAVVGRRTVARER